MKLLLPGLLAGAWLASGTITAATNAAPRAATPRPPATEASDPVEQEYQRLLADDDAAQAEVGKWIQENQTFKQQGADFSDVTLNSRMDQRLAPVRKAYEDFLRRHPDHARARLAFGSFLNDLSEEDEAVAQWEKARDLDPKNPAAWNNLADHYSRHGAAGKALECLDQALKINPREPVYYRNLGTLVFLERKVAMDHYHLADEQQVLRRALDLYRQARQLDPENFPLATDLAQVYYYLKPGKADDPAQAKAAADKQADEAINAWLEARKLVRSDLDREGVAIHLARVCLLHDRLDQARQYLAEIKSPSLAAAKKTLQNDLDRRANPQPPPPASSATGAK